MARPLLSRRDMRASSSLSLASLSVFTVVAAVSGCSSGAGSTLTDDAGSDAAVATDGGGPQLYFHVRATTAPFAHTDGFSGQTATATKQGIRALRLLRSATDPSPVVIFDHGKGFVEAGYDDGDDTLVGSASAASLPSGRFTVAQIVVTHSRFHVTTTMHAAGANVPGDFDCVQTLSDDTTLDGVTHPAGWYRYVFETGGTKYPQEGSGAILPTSPENGGFTLKSSGGERWYELPIDLVIDPALAADRTIVIQVNMDHAFRWEDQDLPSYTKGVYDTTPSTYEPVRHFGANAFTVTTLAP